MKSLKHYITEAEAWINTPVPGDDFAINVREDVLLETYICDSDHDSVLLYADQAMFDAMTEQGLFDWPRSLQEGVMSEIDIDLRHIGRTENPDALYDALEGKFGSKTQEYLQDMLMRVAQHRGLHPDDQQEEILEIMMDEIVDQYGADDDDMLEAEYQGRKVTLGKPMQGDVAKFKVYVKDPKTGNVKKVNFGDKTMRIKKSNPARRKSFRARHRCANPGPRTKARYWSCRKW